MEISKRIKLRKLLYMCQRKLMKKQKGQIQLYITSFSKNFMLIWASNFIFQTAVILHLIKSGVSSKTRFIFIFIDRMKSEYVIK